MRASAVRGCHARTPNGNHEAQSVVTGMTREDKVVAAGVASKWTSVTGFVPEGVPLRS